MSEPKFTPGPWRVCRSNEDFDGPFYALDDDDYERPINAIRSKSETVACAHDLFEFDEANANLIAAAPDLYKALANLEPYLDAIVCYASTIEEHPPNGFILETKAALAKARGER